MKASVMVDIETVEDAERRITITFGTVDRVGGISKTIPVEVWVCVVAPEISFKAFCFSVQKSPNKCMATN